MTIVPITHAAAKAFIMEHHRHNLPPVGWVFCAALEDVTGGGRGRRSHGGAPGGAHAV